MKRLRKSQVPQQLREHDLQVLGYQPKGILAAFLAAQSLPERYPGGWLDPEQIADLTDGLTTRDADSITRALNRAAKAIRELALPISFESGPRRGTRRPLRRLASTHTKELHDWLRAGGQSFLYPEVARTLASHTAPEDVDRCEFMRLVVTDFVVRQDHAQACKTARSLMFSRDPRVASYARSTLYPFALIQHGSPDSLDRALRLLPSRIRPTESPPTVESILKLHALMLSGIHEEASTHTYPSRQLYDLIAYSMSVQQDALPDWLALRILHHSLAGVVELLVGITPSSPDEWNDLLNASLDQLRKAFAHARTASDAPTYLLGSTQLGTLVVSRAMAALHEFGNICRRREIPDEKQRAACLKVLEQALSVLSHLRAEARLTSRREEDSLLLIQSALAHLILLEFYSIDIQLPDRIHAKDFPTVVAQAIPLWASHMDRAKRLLRKARRQNTHGAVERTFWHFAEHRLVSARRSVWKNCGLLWLIATYPEKKERFRPVLQILNRLK